MIEFKLLLDATPAFTSAIERIAASIEAVASIHTQPSGDHMDCKGLDGANPATEQDNPCACNSEASCTVDAECAAYAQESQKPEPVKKAKKQKAQTAAKTAQDTQGAVQACEGASGAEKCTQGAQEAQETAQTPAPTESADDNATCEQEKAPESGDPMKGKSIIMATQELMDEVRRLDLNMNDVNKRVRDRAAELGLSYGSVPSLLKAVGFDEARRVVIG